MFERSEDHQILYHLMQAVPSGELIGYAAMSEAVGKPVTGSFGPLRAVLLRLLKEDGIVFANEPTIGYRHLTPEQTVDAANGDRARLHRHAGRSSHKLATVDVEFHRLNPERRLAYAVRLSLFQAMMAATTKRASKLLEAHVSRTDMRPLPFAETLKAFEK